MNERFFRDIELYFKENGFNLIRRVDLKVYDANCAGNRASNSIMPDAVSGILIGFAGREFWNHLNDFIDGDHGSNISDSNPVDDYTLWHFEQSKEILSRFRLSHEFCFPFGYESMALDFSLLGKLSGVGVPSLLGILIDPEYGTWISIRGLIITDLEFGHYDKPLDGFNPCPDCSKPCITSCPSSSIGEVVGWDHNKCIDYWVESGDCINGCYSRIACPYGAEHRYSSKQMTHHQKSVFSYLETQKHRL